MRLGGYAKQISEGNLDVNVDVSVLGSGQEIIDLANSFKNMVSKLHGKILEVEKIDEELRRRGGELEKMNKFMVGREIKMTELKKKIEELEKRSPNKKVL